MSRKMSASLYMSVALSILLVLVLVVLLIIILRCLDCYDAPVYGGKVEPYKGLYVLEYLFHSSTSPNN